MAGHDVSVGAGHPPDDEPSGQLPPRQHDRATPGEVAGAVLRAIPTLGLSPADRRTVTSRAEMFLDAALAGQTGTTDTRRHARRLVAVLRATGNHRAADLADTVRAFDRDPTTPG